MSDSASIMLSNQTLLKEIENNIVQKYLMMKCHFTPL